MGLAVSVISLFAFTIDWIIKKDNTQILRELQELRSNLRNYIEVDFSEREEGYLFAAISALRQISESCENRISYSDSSIISESEHLFGDRIKIQTHAELMKSETSDQLGRSEVGHYSSKISVEFLAWGSLRGVPQYLVMKRLDTDGYFVSDTIPNMEVVSIANILIEMNMAGLYISEVKPDTVYQVDSEGHQVADRYITDKYFRVVIHDTETKRDGNGYFMLKDNK